MHFAATHSFTHRARSLRRLGLAATLALTGLWSSAQAGPLYYTFEGNINSSNSYGGTTYFADTGLTVGSAVSYTLLVDFDQQTSITRYDGTTTTYTDGSLRDYFWTDYIAGSALMNDSLGPYSGGGWVAEFNQGYQFENYGRLLTGSHNSFLDIWTSQLASTWEVGESLRFYDFLRTNNNSYSYYERIDGDLTLASIAETYGTAAVPEPGTLALMGLGLVGMCLRRRVAGVASSAA